MLAPRMLADRMLAEIRSLKVQGDNVEVLQKGPIDSLVMFGTKKADVPFLVKVNANYKSVMYPMGESHDSQLMELALTPRAASFMNRLYVVGPVDSSRDVPPRIVFNAPFVIPIELVKVLLSYQRTGGKAT